MYGKRDEELCEKVDKILSRENLSNISEEERMTLSELEDRYKDLTYDKWEDRHKYYQDMVSTMINDMGFKDKEMAHSIAIEHPTLQQNFMRLVCLFIHEMAEKKYFDDRNKGSVELAKALEPIVKEKGFLPFI